MSCLMLTAEAHATLANSIRCILDNGYAYFGFDAPAAAGASPAAAHNAAGAHG